jgi:hypothetical protein
MGLQGKLVLNSKMQNFMNFSLLVFVLWAHLLRGFDLD